MRTIWRPLAAVALWSLSALSPVRAQQYVISTYAGGAPPPTPAPAVAGSIGAPTSVAMDTRGNVYFASRDLNVVFKLDPSGVLTRVAGTSLLGYSGDGGPATSARLQLFFGYDPAAAAGVAVDRAGNLFIADTSNHRIRRVSPEGIITTVAGNGTRGFSGDGGPATSAQLNYPPGVAVDGGGNLFIVDAFNFRIRKVSASGIITTVAGNGTGPDSGDGGPATSARLAPWGLAVDGAGNLFVAEESFIRVGTYASWRVRKVSATGIITTVAGGGTFSGAAGDGGPATSAQLGPRGVTVDSAGNLLIADWPIGTTGESSGRIRKVSPGGIITTVAGGGTQAGASGDGGPATSALLDPAGVAIDSAGNLFIADRQNYRLRKVSPSGIITTVAGNGTGRRGWSNGGPATDGGPATSSQLSWPQGVAADRTGNLFIADSGNHRIRKVSAGGIITTVAGNGTQGFSGDGGPATSAQLSSPLGAAVDGAGNVFFVDFGNRRVRKVSSSGIITTVAGNGTFGSSGDGGPATSAALGGFICNRACGGLAVDGAGNVFIAEGESGRVRKVSSNGIITTVAGGGSDFPGDGGLATDAQLSPVGVTLDGTGNLFIADLGSWPGRVRKVSPSGIITTVAGGGLTGSSGDGGPATSAQLSFPYGLAVDGAGNLFIADPGPNFFAGGDAGDYPTDHRIRKVSPSGIITTVAGDGRRDFSGDGGPASTATLNGPTSVAVDGAGNLYVADTDNHVVRILRPTNRSVLIGAVVDAASQRADPVSPGKIVVLYGAGLGPAELIQNQPRDGVLGTELAGTTVSFNGIAVPILYTSATGVAGIVPYAITGTTAQVTVTYQGQVSAAFAVPVAASAPSLFTFNQAGWGQAAAINAGDGTVNTAANPVQIGGYISLYATGEGQTTPAGVDGRLAGATPPQPVLAVRVTVGGIPATVQYRGGAPGYVAGLMQVNVQIPSGVQPGGYVPVVLQVGERTSSPAVWIAVSGN